MLDIDELRMREEYNEVMQDLTPELKIILTNILTDLCEDGFDAEQISDEDIMPLINWYFDSKEYLPMRKEVMLDNIKYIIGM